MSGLRATCFLVLAMMLTGGLSAAERPNVVLVMTDDQGFGDLGFHGNPVIKTPHLDALAQESVRFTNFYVSPVCAPTRASLMTGRYNYRTGVVDTYIGRAMMHGDEVTLAEVLGDAGYRTGIFGKWHLGDNYPLRPMDQGFQESLIHRGGGVGQPSDPLGTSYFDPILQHNGVEVQTSGYCSDVYTDAAIDFAEASGDEPFLVYLAYNCPHTPLEVPEYYEHMYADADFDQPGFSNAPNEVPDARHKEDVSRKIYGMVGNIDDNIGRLRARLHQLGVAENTIFIFLTDNGPQQARYNGGLRGLKGSVFEGGIHVPFFISYPAKLKSSHEIDIPAAHIDVLPTLIDLCGVERSQSLALDGRSLAPLLDETSDVDWAERRLYFQWHRGDAPEMGRAFAARGHRYKLVQANVPQPRPEWKHEYMLFDLQTDPGETKNIAKEQPEIFDALKRDYEAWFADVSASRGYDPPRIHLGTEHEKTVVLTRQDWRGPRAGWRPADLGHYEVKVTREGPYDAVLRFPALKADARVVLILDDKRWEIEAEAGAETAQFKGLSFPEGDRRITGWIEEEGQPADTPYGVHFIEVTG